MYLILSVLLGAVWLHSTEGCSCQPTHPQIQYCRADYVMRAKIISRETIYPIQPETTTIIPPTERPSVPLAPWMNEPLSAARRGPPGLMEFPPFADLADPNSPTHIVYTAYVEKIYKGDEFITARESIKIITSPSDGLCGVTYLQTSNRYILSGKIRDGELSISICDYINSYSAVTKRQKQGLKYHWKKDCDQCSVGVCFAQYCPTHIIPNRCMLDIAPSDFSCETNLARCGRNKNGECTWYGKKDYKECQQQRAQENIRSLPFLP